MQVQFCGVSWHVSQPRRCTALRLVSAITVGDHTGSANYR